MTHASFIVRKDKVMIPFEHRLLPVLHRIISRRHCVLSQCVVESDLCAIIDVSDSDSIATITLNNRINKTGHHSAANAMCPLVK